MKKMSFVLCLSVLFLSQIPAYAKFPVHLGGFTLGDDIANYPDRIHAETCREVPFNPYLAEGEIAVPMGFKSGQIAYGLCDAPQKILRIKLKYADPSKSFFNKLLDRYKRQLGDPDEYKGDPFQTLIAWKWSFTNEKGEKTSLILQHNVVVEDEKIGTAVKLTLTSQIEKERACFMQNSPEEKTGHKKMPKMNKQMWQLFVPH